MVKNKIKQKRTPNFFLYPLFFLVVVIPLVVVEHNLYTPLSKYPWYPDGEQMDLFLYWKSVLIILSAVTMLALLFWKQFMMYQKVEIYEKKRIYLLFAPLLLYEGMAILSSIFSSYSYYAVHGTLDQFESLWVLLSYGVITFYAFYIVTGEESLKKLLFFFLIGTCGIVFIGISQFIGLDFYEFVFRQRNYDFVFGKGRVYGTFYNPNYVGSYTALTIPIVLMLFVQAEKKLYKLAYGILSILLAAVLLGSRSATGFFISGFIFSLLLLFNRRKLSSYKKVVIPILVFILLLCFIGRDYIKANYIDKLVAAMNAGNEKESPDLESIVTGDKNVQIIYRGNTLFISFEVVDESTGNYTFITTDEDGKGILKEINEEDATITLTDERFSGIMLFPAISKDLGGISAFGVIINEKVWYFTNQTDGSYYYITALGKIDKIESHPSAIFEENGSFASGRGYIWSKTIPLLKDTVLLGLGPDSFTAVFPNGDYVDAYNNGYENVFVTRPHNMYLQIGTQTGILSLLAILIFYGIYGVSSIRLYWKNNTRTLEESIGLGIFLGTLGYMLAGMINDSSVTVAPLFWCFLGIGLSINQRIVKNSIKELKE